MHSVNHTPVWPRHLLRACFLLLAISFGATALLLIPAYGVFMVVWLHVGLAQILPLVVPVAAVLLLLCWLSARAASKRLREPR